MADNVVKLNIPPVSQRVRHHGHLINLTYDPKADRWIARATVRRDMKVDIEKIGKRRQDAERMMKLELDKIDGG